MIDKCSIDDCDRTSHARGWCRTHHMRWLRHGTIDLLPSRHPSPAERLTTGLTRMPNGCLEWTGSTNSQGYGHIKVGGKTAWTHRLAWELTHGPISDGLWILHRCDNPPCCDPEHLFLGTPAENNADRDAKGRHSSTRITHCPQGHPYDDANTFINARGHRCCRICIRLQAKQRTR